MDFFEMYDYGFVNSIAINLSCYGCFEQYVN